MPLVSVCEHSVFDISDMLICCSKVALGVKSCSRLLAVQKVAGTLPSTITSAIFSISKTMSAGFTKSFKI